MYNSIIYIQFNYKKLSTNFPRESILKSIQLTKITAAQNEVTLSYHSVRGLYFLTVIFAATKKWEAK